MKTSLHLFLVLFDSFAVCREEWEEGHGGWVSYIVKDEEDGELITVLPAPNALTIVYRDTGCLQFVKYVNRTAPSVLYDVTLTYKEKEGNE